MKEQIKSQFNKKFVKWINLQCDAIYNYINAKVKFALNILTFKQEVINLMDKVDDNVVTNITMRIFKKCTTDIIARYNSNMTHEEFLHNIDESINKILINELNILTEIVKEHEELINNIK